MYLFQLNKGKREQRNNTYIQTFLNLISNLRKSEYKQAKDDVQDIKRWL